MIYVYVPRHLDFSFPVAQHNRADCMFFRRMATLLAMPCLIFRKNAYFTPFNYLIQV